MDRIPYIPAIVVCLHLAACQPLAREAHLVKVVSPDSLYQVGVPSFMHPGYDMHPFASLQYYDTTKQFFVLGLEDSKDNLGAIKRRRLKLKGYFNYAETIALERVDSFVQEAGFQDTLPHGLVVQSQDYFALNRPFPDLPLFYRVAAFENNEYFYQLVIWMPYETHCANIHWIDSITRSLAFLPPVNPLTRAR